MNREFDPANVFVSLFEQKYPYKSQGGCDDEKMREYHRAVKFPKEIMIRDFLEIGTRYIPELEKVWKEEDKDKRNDLKSLLLPFATISCTLRTRDKEVALKDKILNYTGLVVMDFDHVPDIEEAKSKVAALPYVWYAGLSCSKRGFFAIVPTDNTDYTRHKLYCLALEMEMQKIGLKMDEKCYYVQCTRYASFDTHPIYNDHCVYYSLPEGFEENAAEELARRIADIEGKSKKERGGKESVKTPAAAQMPEELTMKKIELYAKEWERKNVALDDYLDWLKIGMSLCRYGEYGWSILDRISKFSSKYNMDRNRMIWDGIEPESVRVQVGSFFFMCHRYGVMPNIHQIYDEVPFPVEVFPDDVQNIINETNRCLNFTKDHIASSLLFVASIAIGNSLEVQFKNNWRDKAILYMALVGKPGTNKSAPLKFAMTPIDERDAREMLKFREEYTKYDAAMKTALRGRGEIPVEPKCRQTVMTDFTTEVLMRTLSANPRGIAVYVDELMGFIRNFNKYRAGNDEQVWTQIYNGYSLVVNRINSQPINITDTFVGIIGTLQPGMLPEFAKGKKESGFLDRWLFSYPEIKHYPRLNMEELDPAVPRRWSEIIERIYTLPIDEQRRVIRLTDDAARIYLDWYNSLADLKDHDRYGMAEAATKMERYCMRFSIILEALKYGCGQEEIKEVSADSIRGAIDLCTYYLSCTFKARHQFRRDPTDSMNTVQKSVYSELPIQFTTAEGLMIALEMGMKERTFKDWVKTDFFKHVSHGLYEKTYR